MMMSGATFEANPNDEHEPFIEKAIFEGSKFRIWHVIFFAFCVFIFVVVCLCCCIKIRVPRTKQEIEADYQRKKLTKKFKKRLELIQNDEMMAINLKKALEIVIDTEIKNEIQNMDAKQPENFINGDNENLMNPNSPKKMQNFGKLIANMRRVGQVY